MASTVALLPRAKDHAKDQGGKITHDSALLKSFQYVASHLSPVICTKIKVGAGAEPYLCSVEFPEDAVHSLASNEHIDVEADTEVKTQNVS